MDETSVFSSSVPTSLANLFRIVRDLAKGKIADSNVLHEYERRRFI